MVGWLFNLNWLNLTKQWYRQIGRLVIKFWFRLYGWLFWFRLYGWLFLYRLHGRFMDKFYRLYGWSDLTCLNHDTTYWSVDFNLTSDYVILKEISKLVFSKSNSFYLGSLFSFTFPLLLSRIYFSAFTSCLFKFSLALAMCCN